MRNMENEWIALGFGEGPRSICRVIRMDGGNGFRKELKGICIVKNVYIYHMSFNDHMLTVLAKEKWPEGVRMTDMILTYSPKKKGGELQIEGTDVVWRYSVAELMEEWEEREGH